MSQQGPGFTNPTQPRPGRSQSSQSSYGANSNQQGGRGPGGSGRGRNDFSGRGPKRGGPNVGPNAFEDQSAFHKGQHINFQVESNGGPPAPAPSQLAPNGPPGGALAFGSFEQPPVPTRHSANQQPARPNMAQQHSGSIQGGPQQTQLGRRPSSGGRNNGYKHQYDPQSQSTPQQAMHFGAGFNTGPQGSQNFNISQQQGYGFASQGGFYPQYGSMMMSQGSYPQNYSGAQQSQNNRPQPMPNQFQRPSQQQGRAQSQAQPHQQPQASAPAARRKKALDIIDPTTHSKVEISPRSAEAAVSEQGSAKPTPTPSPHKEQPLAKPESKALPITSADKDDITASQVPSSQAAAILDSGAASSQPQPKSTAGSDPPGQATSQQQEASQTIAAQQPQQPAEHAKPSTSATDAAPAKQQAAVVGQQDAHQKQQASKPAEQQPAAAAAPKAGGAWGGAKSFRDIAAGNKPDKVAEDKQASEEEAKQKAEEVERKAEADRKAEAERKAAAEQKAETERKAEAEKQAEAKRKADAEKAQQEAEAKAKAEQEAAEKKKAEQEAAAAEEEAQRKHEKEQQEAEQERQRKEQADKEAAAEAKRKVETEAKAKAEQEAEAKRKADAEAEAKRKAEAERQAEAEQKAAADKEAADNARKQEEAAAAAAQKKKDDEAKAAKASADEAAKAKSDKPEEATPATATAAAPAAASSSSLSAKQKRKDMMKRAEEKDTAAGYEDPFQPKQAAAAHPAIPAAGPQPVKTQAETSGRSASGDVDEDDWEQTAERTPRGLTGGPSSGPASTSGRKGYTLDWMLRQQDNPDCQHLPQDLSGELVVPGWRYRTPAEVGAAFGEPTRVPGGGRHGGMGPPGGRGMGPRNIGPPAGLGGPVDKWQQSGPIPALADPRARGAPPMGMAQGGRGGPGRGAGNVEGDRWGKRALPPPPPGAGGAAVSNLPALHKAENKFKLGEVQGDNPEEIKKQKAIKGLLNKITPEKFDKILNDIIAVGYETEQTESGLIDQVFDKALTETTFCEIYADLCFQLNSRLPSFEPEAHAGKKRTSTFRKQLLNKCQEEFEKGAAAMEAVEAREKAESSKTKEQKEQDQAEAAEASGSEEEASTADANDGGEAQEEGEIAAPATPADKKAQRLQARRAAAQAAADELKARQRALGNIQFIGHLYRKKMLTEKIMHECIKKLLADVEQPKQEDLECLSKLMSTVGRQLDSNLNAKMYMDAYFERVFMLSKNQSLDSRIRFMLQDLLDLRHNAWVARREVEGPKKIDQVHADARREESNRARAAAGGGPNRGSRGGDYGRSSGLDAYGGPPQRRMPSRHDSMIDSPVRPMQRNSSQEFTSFRPGGGPGPGSLRPGGASSGAMLPRSSSLAPPGQSAPTDSRGAGGRREAQAEPAAAPSQAPAPQAKALSRDDLENKVRGTLEEYMSVNDKAEVTQTVKELLDQAAAEAAQVFAQIPLVAIGKMRGVNWDSITELMVHLCSGDQAVIPQKRVHAGCRSLLNTMGTEDVLGDAPKAADWVGGVLGALVAEGVLPLQDVGTATLKAAVEEEGEDGQLVDGGSAWKLIGAVLKAVAKGTSQAQMARLWKETGLDFKDFFPQFERDDEGLDKRVAKAYDLNGLTPKPDIKPHIQEAIGKGTSSDAIVDWVKQEVGQDALKDPDTAKQLTLAVLRHAIPNPKELNLDEKLAPLSPREKSGDLLIITSSKGGLKAEVGAILGAQQFFYEAGAPKRLMQRLLEDLVVCGSVTYDAVQDWQHDNKDQTPGKEAAIKDSAKLVASLAAKDAENTDINN